MNKNKQETILIVTWIVVLIIGLIVPQCIEKNAQKANEEYQKLKNNTEYQVVD